jgi:hypothetical protein
VDANSIRIAAGSSAVASASSPVFASSPTGEIASVLWILYANTTAANTERISALTGHFLHIGELIGDPEEVWELCLAADRLLGCAGSAGFPIRSVIVSVPHEGDYRLAPSENLALAGAGFRFNASEVYAYVPTAEMSYTPPSINHPPLSPTGFFTPGMKRFTGGQMVARVGHVGLLLMLPKDWL